MPFKYIPKTHKDIGTCCGYSEEGIGQSEKELLMHYLPMFKMHETMLKEKGDCLYGLQDINYKKYMVYWNL